jgi:hypothetical protein
MNEALQVLNGAVELSTVDIFIRHVNSRFAMKADELPSLCHPSMGQFYTVSMQLRATPEDCQAIEEAFSPGWKGVTVVYWHGKLSIHLDISAAHTWGSYYNGTPLNTVLAADKNE